MSEQKPPKTWAEIQATFKAEMTQLLDEKIMKLMPTPPPTSTPSQPSKEVKEEDPFDHIHSCPTCKAKLEKEKEEYAKNWMVQTIKERKNKPYECVDCGTRVEKEEEFCPTCGGKQARSRR